MLRTAVRSSVLLVMMLPGGFAFAENRIVWRLFVSDHAEPVVRVLDLKDRAVIDTFQLKGPASLKRSISGHTVFATQGSANTVTAIASGLSFDENDQRQDFEIKPPKLLLDIRGNKPSHLIEGGGQIALFFDGDGTTRLTTEKLLLDAKASMTIVNSGAPHHGVAAFYGNFALVSAPNKEKPDELPLGINLFDKTGKQVGKTHMCPDLAGAASSGKYVVFACTTGLLIVSPDMAKLAFRHVAYPKTLPKGKITKLLGSAEQEYFLGSFGPDKLLRIDPTTDEVFRLIELPAPHVHFATNPGRWFAYVLTEDGKLHQYDTLAGAITKSLQLTEPYVMDGKPSDPHPRIAVGGDKIAVTDPQKGLIHLVDTTSFAKASEIQIPGMPSDIVFIGGSGKKHKAK